MHGRTALLASTLSSLALPLGALQIVTVEKLVRVGPCQSRVALEFIAPMPAESVPNLIGASPFPESWTIALEIAAEQIGPPLTRVFEGTYLPSPGAVAPLPTDVNGDMLMGDPHPAIPQLTLVMDDILVFNGFPLPPGTNLASFFELIGSELEHGGGQSTTVTWVLDPQWMLFDVNGDMGTNLTATINGANDTVFVKHGFDPLFTGVHSAQNPTISIWTSDWISTVDALVLPPRETPFLVCVEARIPCFFDPATVPPTPIPVDPIFGPCWAGAMACTGSFPVLPGPGPNPMFPSLDVRFSDSYLDTKTGSFVPGGTISGGQCGVLWNATGGSMAFAFRQASVHAWYGVNGVPDTGPLGGGDDQLIYRFVMIADGQTFDTDVLPQEMLITAAIETTTNCFSITNVRVKHRPDVRTPNPF
ncbi:MAG: hypothetical protein HOP15_04590 [Planctomycetes bacterium]|nr:hypothetical protein [Planctomycetota bacterium]